MAEVTEKQSKVLEKLIRDEEFRKSFFEDPDAAMAKAGIEINEEEMAELRAMNQAAYNAAMADYDARVSKSGVSGAIDAQAGIKAAFEAIILRKTK